MFLGLVENYHNTSQTSDNRITINNNIMIIYGPDCITSAKCSPLSVDYPSHSMVQFGGKIGGLL